MNINFLKKLRTISIVEGCSTLVLFFVAMPLKYMADLPIAVTIFGSIHGLLFIVMILTVGLAVIRVPLSIKLALACVIGSIFPFGPFIVDRHLKKLEG